MLNRSRPVPGADTGSRLRDAVSDTVMALLRAERRIDPFVRPAFDALLRDRLARLVTRAINSRRTDDGLSLAEEKRLPDEDTLTDSIVQSFTRQADELWRPGPVERGGNTKTHGLVRGELVVHDDLPEHLRRGIYARPQRFPAWVRFAGPGPYAPPDIDDIGVLSISVKLMGVPGPKLLDDEQYTLDMFGVSTPTFVTPDAGANAALQRESVKNAQIFYFLNRRDPHLLDMIMQGLYARTQTSPLESPYFSCVPYLLGEGQAMQYSFWPVSTHRSRVPRLPRRPPDDYLRDAMVTSLARGDAEFDVRLQVQTDAHLMPIENAGVLWPRSLSPRVSVATLRIPRQVFARQSQYEFAQRLSMNPWHTVAEHRPLGNQNRVRRRMYQELSARRHLRNGLPSIEPEGDEVFR